MYCQYHIAQLVGLIVNSPVSQKRPLSRGTVATSPRGMLVNSHCKSQPEAALYPLQAEKKPQREAYCIRSLVIAAMRSTVVATCNRSHMIRTISFLFALLELECEASCPFAIPALREDSLIAVYNRMAQDRLTHVHSLLAWKPSPLQSSTRFKSRPVE